MQTYNTRTVRTAAPTENMNAKPFGGLSAASAANANANATAAAATAAAQAVRVGATKRAALGDISNAAKLKAAAKKSTTATSSAAAVFLPGAAQVARPSNVVKATGRTAQSKASYAEDMALDSRASDMHEAAHDDDDGEDVLVDVALEPSQLHQMQQQQRALQQQQQQLQQQQLQLHVPAGQFEDIDVYDEDDAQCVTEYIVEIFGYLRQKELAERVDGNYMLRQTDLTPKMRAILVDWMVDVHLKFKLLSETMFLSVSIIDRYLALKPISRHKLQLVGITAMLIASKYEELYSPEVRDFVHICDKAFNKDEILALEIQILNALNFSLTPATPLHFLRRFSKAARSDSTTHTLSKYLVELALPEYELLAFKPSTIAAAAVYIARAMRQLTPFWTPTLEFYTQHGVKDLRECATQLNAALLRTTTSTLKATRRKYSSPKLLSVGRIPALATLTF